MHAAPNMSGITTSITAALTSALDHHGAGRLSEAEHVYRQILALKPDHPDALHLLGALCLQLGRAEEAVRLMRHSIAVNPNVAIVHTNLGNALELQGRFDEAAAAHKRAVAIDPALAAAHFNFGRALHAAGRAGEAVGAFETCAALQPGYAPARVNLGVACRAAGDLDRAVAEFRSATDIDPNEPLAFAQLADVLAHTYRLEEAVHAARRAVELDPGHAPAYASLALALLHQGRVRESIQSFRAAIRLAPELPVPHQGLLLALHYDHSATPRDVFAEHVRFGERFAGKAAAVVHVNDRSPDRRLRVGYLSADFRDHPVGYFIEPLLAHHDRGRFQVFCYAHDVRHDAVTDRLRGYDLTWRSVRTLGDDDAVARRIRDDRIDVLVDLGGHTADTRLLVLTRRPAPVQVTYLGYPDTTGMPDVNYRLTDHYADPVEGGVADALSVERLYRLPRTAWCYQPSPGTPPVNPLPARSIGRVTFASFNAVPKINPATIELWAELLARIPASRIVLKAVAFLDDATGRRIVEEFERCGVDGSRVITRPPLREMSEHLASYHEADVALDPFPYNGTTTTCEAMWMGVPVVTLAGDSHVSRVGRSLLSNAGMPELVARTRAEFLDIASALAADLDRLGPFRATLRQRMQNSPLLDAPGFARDVEDAYRSMWKEWCRA